MARKDDPVFNVKFVQLVESQACLWNYTHPGYSKKEEVQRAWQHVANEIKDTVRNCRERWRTIRSSFLRSLKLARTQTGRGKRKYYLSKYLQFLIPYTKSRSCHKQVAVAAGPTTAGMVLRKPSTSTAATFLAGVGHLRMVAGQVSEEEEEAKESVESEGETHMPLDVQVSEEEDKDHRATHSPTSCLPLRLQSIKVEQQQPPQQHSPTQPQTQQSDKIVAHQSSLVTLPATMAAALGHHHNLDNWTELAHWFKGSGHHHHSSNNNNNSSSGVLSHHKLSTPPPQPATVATPAPTLPTPAPAAAAAAIGPSGAPGPDADYSFLVSLHPYLKEMSGKQNRRFRQKVVGLIDNVLDNVDV
ncbi:uncharacterized protein LOC117903588 [Drosophila subobscura]|uniref:uncharacterized protein LOC117903588 n=1 Tax=Drosophila subobscura TaxID=7241 RepID=UPI00155AFFDC|nr:uncharacterized protein LOC117903588 [Drosophila subobscura]XP_034671700.1 uncharacterized protein LOC117903588 [Drosophila subobscura]